MATKIKTLFVVGRVIRTENKKEPAWLIVGVFEDQKFAEDICEGTDYFVGPVPLNALLPTEEAPWPGLYYPAIEKRKGEN